LKEVDPADFSPHSLLMLSGDSANREFADTVRVKKRNRHTSMTEQL
jgi:hypothetical protein